jgi:hypothetical protein
MGRDKASELPLLQCEAARGAAAKLPAATRDKTANTSVNRFIGNDPTFFFRFADAPVGAPVTVAPWTFARVRSFTEKAQIAYSHGHPPLSARGCGASPGGPGEKGVAPRLAFPNEFAR